MKFSVVVLVLLATLSAGDPPSVEGDWAGWLYLDQGGDAPLRLHVKTSELASLDFPHAKLFDSPLLSFRAQESKIIFERRNSEGQLQRYTGRLAGDLITGTARLGDANGRFELHRSPRPLPIIDPDKYADCRGVYRFPSGRSLIITPRFWGELVALDTSTGANLTLFPISEERFFLGSALYVPGPSTALIHCLRDSNGRVTQLQLEPVGSAPELGQRIDFLEEPVSFQNGMVRLAGTLIRPPGKGPFPAIVVLGGSHWDTRQTIRADADILTSFGWTVLIYDKRGYGDSQGDRTVAFSTTAEDALAAVQFLKERADIRADRVGLAGRSRGGWIAPLAASRSQDVDFLLLLVAPAVSPAQQETTRRLNVLRSQGISEGDLSMARTYLKLQFGFAQSGQGWEEYAVARERIQQSWLEVLGGAASPDPEDWLWARLNMHYDPLPALEKIRLPVLALFGELDTNVVPAENLPLMEQAFSRAGNSDATLFVVEGADHGLRSSSQAKLPLHRKTGYAPDVWKIVQEWLERISSG